MYGDNDMRINNWQNNEIKAPKREHVDEQLDEKREENLVKKKKKRKRERSKEWRSRKRFIVIEWYVKIRKRANALSEWEI